MGNDLHTVLSEGREEWVLVHVGDASAKTYRIFIGQSAEALADGSSIHLKHAVNTLPARLRHPVRTLLKPCSGLQPSHSPIMHTSDRAVRRQRTRVSGCKTKCALLEAAAEPVHVRQPDVDNESDSFHSQLTIVRQETAILR